MPEISRFLGIVIAMYYNDHAPPHFHARYGGSRSPFGSPTESSKGAFRGARSVMCSSGTISTKPS